MKPEPLHIRPDWRWGTAEGSREFDRLLDRSLSFREKLQWIEEAEALTLRLLASREAGAGGEKDLADVRELKKLEPYR